MLNEAKVRNEQEREDLKRHLLELLEDREVCEALIKALTRDKASQEPGNRRLFI